MKRDLRSIIALIAILILFALAAAGNWFLTTYFLDNLGFRTGFFVALGLLVVQPVLLSIWCALGNQNTMLRLLFSIGMLVVLTFVYTKVLDTDGAPLEVTLVLCGIVLAIAAIVQIPLWIFRTLTGNVLMLPPRQLEGQPELSRSQYGIKHLLLITTVVALLTTLLRILAPEKALEGRSNAVPWFELSVFLLTFIVAKSLLAFLTLGAVFNQKRRLRFVFAQFVFLIVMPLVCLEVLRRSNLFGVVSVWEPEPIISVFVFFWSLSAAIIIGLGTFYLIGYRLMKPQ